MDQMNTMTPVQSNLKMEKVVFDDLSFHRKDFKRPDAKTEFGVSKEVQKISDGCYRVIVQTIAERKGEYIAKIQISGFCSIDESLENKDILLNSNAVAILFPYVRAQLTLLTAQPEMEPIVLPVVNIVKMIEETDKNKETK